MNPIKPGDTITVSFPDGRKETFVVVEGRIGDFGGHVKTVRIDRLADEASEFLADK